MKDNVKDKLLYYILYVTALGARAFFFLAVDVRDHFLKYPEFACRLAQGEDMGERILDVSPFYLAYMTQAIKLFNPSLTALELFQLFIGILNCVLIFSLGKRILPRPAAFIGAMLYALCGNIIVLESTFEPLVFEIFFSLCCLLFLVFGMQSNGAGQRPWRFFALSGLFAGLCVVTKPNFLLFFLVALAWIIWIMPGPRGFQKRAGWAAAFFMCALAVIGPCTLRNYIVFHDFVMVTADWGKVFYHGNAQGADGFHFVNISREGYTPEGPPAPDPDHAVFRQKARKLAGRHLSPSEAADFWVKKALDDILRHPRQALMLEFRKLRLFFHDYEIYLIVVAYNKYRRSLAYPFLRYGIISSLALLGMMLAARRGREVFLLHGAVAACLVSGLIFMVTSRYRAPAVPYLCLFAGYAIHWLFSAARQKKIAGTLAGVVLLCGLLYANNLTFRNEIACLDADYRDGVLRSMSQERMPDPLENRAGPLGQTPPLLPRAK